MRAALATVVLALTFAALGAAAMAASAAGPDLAVTITLVPASGEGPLRATEAAHAIAVVTNHGLDAAGAFEVDVTAYEVNQSAPGGIGPVVLRPHSLNVSALPAGANVTLDDPTLFTVALAGDIRVAAVADPAHRLNDSIRADNTANRTLHFEPAVAVQMIENVPDRASGTRLLPAYAYLALRVELREGDSLIFKADAADGALFDCYLFDTENYAKYAQARETPPTNVTVHFIDDYSWVKTDHWAYTSEPLPPGTYYLVIENDERLKSGASPEGPLNVTYAAAIVNNSLPAWAVVVVIGAAAAAIWATVRWRPHFDVRSPLREVPPPEPEDSEGEGELEGGASDLPEEEEGEGEPPHPSGP